MSTAISHRLRKYFDEYTESHKHKVNLLIHKIAIPLIIFHIVAMLSWVKVLTVFSFTINLAHCFALFTLIFYFSLDFFLACCMTVFIGLCFVVSPYVSVPIVIFIAMSAWFLQLLGHYKWEKSSPAFTKNLIQTLIGPLYVLELLTKKRI